MDEETWLHHWKKGDVTDWLRTSIKDDELTAKIAAIEHHVPDDAAVSRKRVRDVIEESYTLPAEGARSQ